MSALSDLAAAVVNRLNDADLSEDFTAARSYMPIYELPDLEDLRVDVVVERGSVEIHDRGGFQRTYLARIIVQKQLDPQTLAEVDALETLMEEIDELFAGVNLSGVYWDNSSFTNPRDAAKLESHRQFTSVLTVTYYTIG